MHATAWYPPHQLGGTEVYVASLAQELAGRGVEQVVAKPWPEAPIADHEHAGIRVRTYAVGAERTRAQLAGAAPHAGFDGFLALLREERPDIYHQHSWTLGLGGPHLHAARELGLRTVLSVHTPNLVCARGVMMRFGRTPCDGRIEQVRCGACWAEGRGAPRPLADLAARAPLARLSGAAARVSQQRDSLAQALADADAIVAVAGWLAGALAANGAPAERLVVSRQGIDRDLAQALQRDQPAPQDGPLRVGYLGRWHPTKGVDVLIRAVRALPPTVPVRAIIHALPAGPDEAAYEAAQRRLAADEPRIVIEPPVSRIDLPDALRGFDVLAIPSLWLETGPLVALEAQAAGVAVLGADAGGIAEFVGCGGGAHDRLVPPGDVSAWSRAIAELAADVDALRRTRAPQAVRAMADAADDMMGVYRHLAG